jgi:hypothetical protein
MSGYPIPAHFLPMHRWRAVLTHAIALVAGVALAMTFLSHAMPDRNPIDVPALPGAASDFDRALRTIMVRMESAMCITPSADADRDFARAMIPHHQGAIEMARLELLHGRDERLRRLAQGIVIEQSQEIELMQSIVANGSVSLSASLNP